MYMIAIRKYNITNDIINIFVIVINILLQQENRKQNTSLKSNYTTHNWYNKETFSLSYDSYNNVISFIFIDTVIIVINNNNNNM